MANGFESIITQLEKRKEAIERALEAIRGIGTSDVPATKARKKSTAVTKVDRRSEGQRRRWAAKKAAADDAIIPALAAVRKRVLSAEGREKLIESMKQRWAAKRAAATTQLKPRKKSAKAKS